MEAASFHSAAKEEPKDFVLVEITIKTWEDEAEGTAEQILNQPLEQEEQFNRSTNFA